MHVAAAVGVVVYVSLWLCWPVVVERTVVIVFG